MANVAALLFTASFAAMLLGNVLFLTRVWDQSVLTAGLQLAPGPVMAAVFAALAGKAANRAGQRTLATAGLAIYGAGTLWWVWQAGLTPNYAAEILPGMLVTGVGVGLVLPSLASAVASSLPPARFATGSAVLTMSRQLGSVLGVAILVAVLGSAQAGDPLGAARDGWIFMAIAAGLGTVAALGIGTVSLGAASAPAPAVEPAR
jgi:MFS family permease